MQEPVLFNISIRDNILYGNEEASDFKVRQMAELANATQFIEQNLEDLSKEELNLQLVANLRQTVARLSQKYPNITKAEDQFKNENVGPEQIRLIDDIFNKSDEKFISAINSDFDRFCKVLAKNMGQPGIKWDDVLLRFEGNYELEQI